ncbi:uncharacterized protein PV09_03662 [Verruconis gallopava]|uniref:Putative lipoate-protein ligase A n=1 Tax=Verruconis gallopava TaxID=253628 RepID=A0A0D2AF54_9PEZI|nr:uncharacterized protein PV09_03662 [Verruconis gallopava]KIW05105.1 hypothetical protein PV09_03662 [Verruconis gallopava]
MPNSNWPRCQLIDTVNQTAIFGQQNLFILSRQQLDSRSMLSPAWRPRIIGLKRTKSGIYTYRSFSSWSCEVSKSSNEFQIYTSNSNDPFVNLSIEHYLFEKSPPDSKVLFLYVNRPCVIIGRNQNPWLEVNLALLDQKRTSKSIQPKSSTLGDVSLVRRRSGGGTVFHDEGNVNWSVICNFTDFTRDKHAEMVVRALRSIGVDRARVNERHDIVLDQGSKWQSVDIADTHRTPYTSLEQRPLKVSGSAYKMARNRALHHGTALLNSPNLRAIPEYLHSPAKPYISAKGVESISSPVSNIGVENAVFVDAVREHFVKQYRVKRHVEAVVDDDALAIPDIRKGFDELTSLRWIFLQTPSFEFSSKPFENRHDHVTSKPTISFKAQHGAIFDCKWTPAGHAMFEEGTSNELKKVFMGKYIHETQDWLGLLQGRVPFEQAQEMAAFLTKMFPSPSVSCDTIDSTKLQ